MTLQGAIKQLHELQSAEDMPFYYKPAIAEVINVLLMDTQEVRHGWWINCGWSVKCSICDYDMPFATRNYCPNCGAKMEGAEE